MTDSFSAREPSLSGTVNTRDPSISGGGNGNGERQRRGPSVGATAAPRPSVFAEGRSRSTLAAVRENSLSSRLKREQARARSHLFWLRATRRIREEQQRLDSDRSAPEVVRTQIFVYSTSRTQLCQRVYFLIAD